MPQVTVSDHVKDQLNDIQTNEQHTSIDSVIRMLIQRNAQSTHTIDADESYSVSLNLGLPNPDNPELIIMRGKHIIAALEECDWKQIDQ